LGSDLRELTALPQTPWLDLMGLILREGKGRSEKWEGIRGEGEGNGWRIGRSWESEEGEGKERRGHPLVLAYMYTPNIKSWIQHCAEPNPNAAFLTNRSEPN